MKVLLLVLTSFSVIAACTEPSLNEGSSEPSEATRAQIEAVNEQTFSCVATKARQYAATPGSPMELGMLAASACQTYINESARVYAAGNPRVEAMNRESFKESMTEAAARMIVERRAN